VEARAAQDSEAVLVRWMSIIDANSAGFVHGGVVMKLCDEAAGIAAVKHSRRRVVTAAIDRMTFLDPVHVGQLLSCKASVNSVWRTSMEVGVRVEAENARTGRRVHTSSAYLVYVALDREGKPRPVPPVVSEDEEQRQRQHEAKLRREARLARKEAILKARAARGDD